MTNRFKSNIPTVKHTGQRVERRGGVLAYISAKNVGIKADVTDRATLAEEQILASPDVNNINATEFEKLMKDYALDIAINLEAATTLLEKLQGDRVAAEAISKLCMNLGVNKENPAAAAFSRSVNAPTLAGIYKDVNDKLKPVIEALTALKPVAERL